MNIFAVDDDPEIAATMLCDQHVVKMPLENCQMFSAVMDMLYKDSAKGPEAKKTGIVHAQYGMPGYPKSVKKHPCTLWLLESVENWMWLLAHHRALLNEYTKRYNKFHKFDGSPMIFHSQKHWMNWEDKPRTKFANATPYKDIDDPIEAYRHFYNVDKSKFARWKYTDNPSWYMAS